jgi:hypothetical protein
MTFQIVVAAPLIGSGASSITGLWPWMGRPIARAVDLTLGPAGAPLSILAIAVDPGSHGRIGTCSLPSLWES